jgi:O-antigen/teichoic acid export membrane protein
LIFATLLKDWAQNTALRVLARNAITLLGGNVASSLFTIVAMVLVARSLQPVEFGVFSLITAFVFVVDGLVNFQSWQAVVKFGAERIVESDGTRLSHLLRITFFLDMLCAMIGAAIGASSAFLLRNLLGWDMDTAQLGAVFSMVILARATGTATGLLRLVSKYGFLAMQQVVLGFSRLVLVCAAYFVHGSLGLFLLAWGVSEVIANLYLLGGAWREYSQRGLFHVTPMSRCEVRKDLRQLWGFVWTTNIHSSVKLAIRELDVLMLGAFAGPRAAGLYKMAKQVGLIFGKAVGPLYQAVYPELASFAVMKDRGQFVAMCVRPAIVVSLVFIAILVAFYFFGEVTIRVTVGVSYVAAFPAALVYLLGSLLSAATFTLHPAVLAMGDARGSLKVLVSSTVIYISIFPYMTTNHGVIGASWAYVVFYLVWSILMLYVVSNRVRDYRWS